MKKITITNIDESVLVFLGETQLNVLDNSDDNIFVECKLEEFKGLDTASVPGNLVIRIQDSKGFETYLFHELEISQSNDSIVIDFIYLFPNKYWEGKWGQRVYLSAIQEQVKYFPEISVEHIELEDDWKALTLRITFKGQVDIYGRIFYAIDKIKTLIKQAEISLGGITWTDEYEKKEDKFCKEIIAPLLRRMDFLSVRYNHGKKEYGKDFTFSELTSFGNLRHYGLQAKAGNISGRVNSEVDELIGQINDAFSMPYYEVGSKDPRYISVFIIAISGHFSENAREKIVEKMPKGVIGSVYFLDKEKIIELIERHCIN